MVFSDISSPESKIFHKVLASKGRGRASSECRIVKIFFNKKLFGFLAVCFQNAGVQFYSIIECNLGFN